LSTFKKLAGQTAIYGLSSIIGRFLTFFLTPLHTAVLSESDFGKNTDLYSVIAFLMVVLTFGMETTFFRYYQQKASEEEGKKILSHTLFPVIGFSVLFLLLLVLFLPDVAALLKYSDNPEYPVYAFVIVMLDAICAVPFAKLRAQNRGVRFVSIRMTQIGLFFVLNYFFFKFCPWLLDQGIATEFIESIYHPQLGVAYIFIANLIASGIMFLLLLPEMKGFTPIISWKLEKQYLGYAAPLVIAGLAGIANEMADRQFLKYLLPGTDEENFAQIGLYGANYKIATFMMMFIQAFRFAAEPFFFSQVKGIDQRQTYAYILKYFALFQVLIFVGLVGFIDVVKLFIDAKYWDGLYLAPILIFANLLVGINLNLNIWYKLEDKTRFGAYITFLGLAFTVLLNVLLIPVYGVLGAAIATVVSYAAMTIFAYYLNQKHYKSPYQTGRMLFYLALSVVLSYICFVYLRSAFVANGLIVLAFAGCILALERKELRTLLGKKP
jgi:O-antigen/teichoic acid export membrane protein